MPMCSARLEFETWWQRYIEDDAFRLQEEVIGHSAELVYRLRHEGDTRVKRRWIMAETVRRLRNPLYQYRVPADHARYLIKQRLCGLDGIR